MKLIYLMVSFLFLLEIMAFVAFSRARATTYYVVPGDTVIVVTPAATVSQSPTSTISPTKVASPTPTPVVPTASPTAAVACIKITSPTSGSTVSGSAVAIVTADVCSGVWYESLFIDGTNVASFAPGKVVMDSTQLTNGSHSVVVTSQSTNPGSVILGQASVTLVVNNTVAPTATPTVVAVAPTCHDAASCATFPLADMIAAGYVNPNLPPVGENESENVTRNAAVPTAAQLTALTPSTLQNAVGHTVMSKVTGAYKGTTNQILQWASYKWGDDPIAYLAEAVNESGWDMDTVGDINNGVSLGILQIKSSDYVGTCPGATGVQLFNGSNLVPCSAAPVLCSSTCLSHQYTAFAADYAVAWMHACQVGGNSYLSNPSFPGYQVSTGPGTAYNDFWICMGAWYSGKWNDSGSQQYVAHIKQIYAAKSWVNLKQ